MAPTLTDSHPSTPKTPHLMDRIYRHQRFIYDASRKYYLLGRDYLINQLQPENRQGLILELGCGTGRNLIHTAKRYPESEIYGLDISTEMLKTAGASIYKAGLEKKIHLALADASRLEGGKTFGVTRFDRIFISFSLSMIPEWETVIRAALAQLTPQGELHIVDFGRCEALPWPAKSALYAWLRLFHVHPIPGMKQRLKEMASMTGHDLTAKPLYGGYSIYACLKKPFINSKGNHSANLRDTPNATPH